MGYQLSPPPTLISSPLVAFISMKYLFRAHLSARGRAAYLGLTNRAALPFLSLALNLTFAHLTWLLRVKQTNFGYCYPPGFL